MAKLPYLFIDFIEGKKIRHAVLYQSDPFGEEKRTGVELEFDDNTCMRFFILGDELAYTPLGELDIKL